MCGWRQFHQDEPLTRRHKRVSKVIYYGEEYFIMDPNLCDLIVGYLCKCLKLTKANANTKFRSYLSEGRRRGKSKGFVSTNKPMFACVFRQEKFRLLSSFLFPFYLPQKTCKISPTITFLLDRLGHANLDRPMTYTG